MDVRVITIDISLGRCSVLPFPDWDKMFSVFVEVFVASKMYFD
jgi:hypothetical protein